MYVIFDILERSSFYGVNERPDNDVSLDEAIQNLKNAFTSQFSIDFEIKTIENDNVSSKNVFLKLFQITYFN